MESRLPKPTAFKRPGPVPPVKPILPTDRIKNAVQASISNPSISTTALPLSRDVQNIAPRRNARAASPEPTTAASLPTRSKLRRSRSASDINELRPKLKRHGVPVLPPISSKFTRFNTTTTITTAATTSAASAQATVSATNIRTVTRVGTVPPKRALSAASSATTVGAVRPISRQPSSMTTKRAAAGGVPPPVPPKRIASYDFKARFHDLLEKHKALKAKYDKMVEDMGELESMPAQLEDSQSQVIKLETSYKNALTEIECLQRQLKQQVSKNELITSSFGRLTEEHAELKTSHQKIKTEHESMSVEVVDLRQRIEQYMIDTEGLSNSLNICREQLFQSNMDRKELHNTVMDLRGNIRVFCRVRPPLETELSRPSCTWTYHDEATVELQSINKMGQTSSDAQAKNIFSFDQVFHSNSTQKDVFDLVAPLIQSALDGYNICIFAYGQTGSGKTYTMDGITDNLGVIPRTVDLLFDSIKNYRNLGWEYSIKATFLEIYNEVLYDLLSNEQKEMEIRMVKNACKNDIYVSNITEETVTDPEHLRQLMLLAKTNRATASTTGNERSSRSHAVTKLELIGQHAEKQEVSVGSINLVDLAGSESPKTSIRMDETKHINRSLSELTNVILSLLQKKDHIPYRNSKLTHLLMPSLGGNSKTLMFINVSPFQDCFQESVKSLRFAASVNSCKMAKAKRNRYLNHSAQSNSSLSCDK